MSYSLEFPEEVGEKLTALEQLLASVQQAPSELALEAFLSQAQLTFDSLITKSVFRPDLVPSQLAALCATVRKTAETGRELPGNGSSSVLSRMKPFLAVLEERLKNQDATVPRFSA